MKFDLRGHQKSTIAITYNGWKSNIHRDNNEEKMQRTDTKHETKKIKSNTLEKNPIQN